jgi:hypothetical protein
MDFLGLMLILNGTYIRMAARGHKKANSAKGAELVTSGPYTIVRNPMYLGTFLIGSGFILILWPWWILPVFGILFYLRFQRQIAFEEEHLGKLFGQAYEDYKQKVPPMFPTFDKLRRMKIQDVLPLKEAWNTKEKRGLITWPLLALFLEVIKDKLLVGHWDVAQSLLVFGLAIVSFIIGMSWEYARV